MLMKKFVGATAREAMQKMKADLGPEALVISNRKIAAGIEILAMVEPESSAAAPPPAPSAAPADPLVEPARSAPARLRMASPFTSLKDFAPRVAPAGVAAAAGRPGGAAWAPQPVNTPAPPGGLAAIARLSAPPLAATASTPAAPPSAGPSDTRLLEEVKSMKALLQTQLAAFAWRDMTERRPLAARLWRELLDAGFSAGLNRQIADRLPDDHNEAQARKWVAGVLTRNLRCTDATRDLVEAGGVYALVGPTRVGKTTTTAKLAARCVVKYGAHSLGLVTTDGYRIGAFDQLAIYGKILGVPVHCAQSYAELEATLGALAGKRLVLIDTTGMGQRDNRVAEQINLLGHPLIRRVLLLNAAAQAETLEDVAAAYRGQAAAAPPLAGVILTKLDEAAKLAPALDVVMRHGLEVMHVTNGQRVPEDIHLAVGHALVHRALRAVSAPVFALRDDEVALRAPHAAAAPGSSAPAALRFHA